MNSKRPSVMKSTAKAGAGGAIAVAAVLALLFLRGGAGTPGSGSESETSNQPSLASTNSPPTSTDTEPASTAATPDSTGGLTQDEELALSDKVLTILVDERSYLLAIPTGEDFLYRPTELARLLELAKLAEGDSNGIRVRILQRETARVSAKQELENQLAQAGVGTDAVYLQSEFIP